MHMTVNYHWMDVFSNKASYGFIICYMHISSISVKVYGLLIASDGDNLCS